MKPFIFTLLGIFFVLNTLQAQEKSARIMSYNIRNCIGMDQVRNSKRIARAIRQAKPDIVSLQELDSVTQRNGGVFTLEVLKKQTGMYGIFASAIPFQGGGYGIGILSKEKPLQHRIVSKPGREEKRTMLIAEFNDYVFCATHQSLTAEDQITSVALINQALEGICKPIFLAGDMNTEPHEEPQKLLSETFITLNDTTAYTFPANSPDRCIDYIYARKKNGYQFHVQQQEVINEPVASDHRPIQVVVRFTPPATKQ